MFLDCRRLERLDVSRWDVSRVKEFSLLFQGCQWLTNLDVSRWDTSSAQDMSGLFDGCALLRRLEVGNWSTGTVRSFSGLFRGCDRLRELDLSRWDGSAAERMDEMFRDCGRLEKLDLRNFKAKRCRSYGNMLLDCPAELLTEDEAFRTLDSRDHWYRGRVPKGEIQALSIVSSFQPDGEEDESWAADQRRSGSILCYRYGRRLLLCGRGYKLRCAADSSRAFRLAEKGWNGEPVSALGSLEGRENLELDGVKLDFEMFPPEEK